MARLVKLFLAFYYGEMGGREEVKRRRRKSSRPDQEGEEEQQEEDQAEGYGLGGLLWDVGSSVGSALLPIYWEEEDPTPAALGPPPPPSSLLGFYIREATLTLKLAASVKQKGFYSGGKQSFLPHTLLRLQGLYAELSSRPPGWAVLQAGVSQISLTPLSHPSLPLEHTASYLLSGCEGEGFLRGSLHQAEQGSEEGTPPRELQGLEQETWEQHLEAWSEQRLLERSPALALDYMYCLELGEEQDSASLSDLEHSDLSERALVRLVLGPASLLLSEGALARARGLAGLVAECETSYSSEKEEPGPEGLQLPSQEEVARLEGNSPVRLLRVTALHPGLVLQRGGVRLELGLRCLDLVHQARQ